MSTGGRPALEDKRANKITIRLNKAELFVIKEKAKKARLSISTYLRKCGVDQTVKPRISVEDRHFFRQLSGLANNLNQMTKIAHEKGLLSALATFNGLINNIDDLIKKFKR